MGKRARGREGRRKDLRETGQIDEGESEDVGRVDSQVDGVWGDTCRCNPTKKTSNCQLFPSRAGSSTSSSPSSRLSFVPFLLLPCPSSKPRPPFSLQILQYQLTSILPCVLLCVPDDLIPYL